MEKLKTLLANMRSAQLALDNKTAEQTRLLDRVKKGEPISDDAIIAADVAYWKAFKLSAAADATYKDACKEYVEEM